MKTKSTTIALVLMAASASLANWSMGYDGSAFADASSYQMQQDEIHFNHASDSQGQTLKVQWSGYRLQDELQGILPFQGSTPVVEASAWGMHGNIWMQGSVGNDGTTDLAGTSGSIVLAYLFPQQDDVAWKSIFSLVREPFNTHPLPLSLSTMRNRIQGGFERKNLNGTFTGQLSLEQWQSPISGIRTRNDTLLQPPEPWIMQALAYWLPSPQQGLAWGWSSGVSHSDRTTQEPTLTGAVWQYSWYPAAAPIWDASISALANFGIWNSTQTNLSLLFSIPMLSAQVRQWDATRVTDWGTAPFSLTGSWKTKIETWELGMDGKLELIPWNQMQFWNSAAYKSIQINVHLQRTF